MTSGFRPEPPAAWRQRGRGEGLGLGHGPSESEIPPGCPGPTRGRDVLSYRVTRATLLVCCTACQDSRLHPTCHPTTEAEAVEGREGRRLTWA